VQSLGILGHDDDDGSQIIAVFFVEGLVSAVAERKLVRLPTTAERDSSTRLNLTRVHAVTHDGFVQTDLLVQSAGSRVGVAGFMAQAKKSETRSNLSQPRTDA